jgi:hypothetical protein
MASPDLMLCRYASLGHPNKKGAVLYADAIIGLLPTAFKPFQIVVYFCRYFHEGMAASRNNL